ncbi:ribbon-helix-helix protein, CopG family [Caldinitratiruptor microaerophilus]|nr:ribbon-helix-helix protein, CopG family [Caldinitratiruptor microaerophilus]
MTVTGTQPRGSNVLTERLEIRLDPTTMRLLREEARRRGISMGQLLRQAIDWFLHEERQARLKAPGALFPVEAPAPDWEVMKREIETARLQDAPR